MRLLHIEASPDPASVTRRLSNAFVEQLKALQPDIGVTLRDLVAEPPPLLDAGWVKADLAQPHERDAAMQAAIAPSEAYIEDLYEHDSYLFSMPMHNFTVPANFKTWIDHVLRAGRTFRYGPGGVEGLLEGKRTLIVTARGGYYLSADPASDFQVPYMKKVMRFIGVTDVAFVHAEGTRMGAAERQGAIAEAQSQLAELARAWAQSRPAAEPMRGLG